MECSLQEANSAANATDGNSLSQSQQSLLSALYKFVSAVKNMDEAVMIPSKLRDMDVGETTSLIPQEENNNKALVPKLPAGSDLYSFYSMLNAVKHEIITGPSQSDDFSDMDDNADENSKKTAAAFRHHLKGIFGLLNQLTETAKFLTHRYEVEVSQKSGNPSSFAM